jgi:hypothetical protein
MLTAIAPPPGYTSDNSTFASPGTWETGSNVRFRLGKPEAIGGFVNAFVGTTLTGVCRNVYAFNNTDGSTNIAFGTHLKLQLYAGGALYDITPSGLLPGSIDSAGESPGWGAGAWNEGSWSDPSLVYFARTWSLDNFGNTLIASPRGGTIYQWNNNAAVPAVAVTNAPAVVDYCLVTPERQLLAFGCNEETSGIYNPLCIRGSDIGNITSWTTTATNNAFEQILEGGGRIVAARLVGPYVAVWTDRGLHLGQFIGDPGQTYRFDLIADHCGLAAPNSLVIADQTAYWLGSDYQFRVWQVGGVPAVLECPIWKDFRDNLTLIQKDKVAGTSVAQFGEVWFFYPDSRDGTESSRFIAFSIIESVAAGRPVWFKGILARTAAADAGATSFPLFVSYGGLIYYHENGTTADGSALNCSITSSDYYIDGSARMVMMRGVIIDFEEQQCAVDMTVYVRRYPRSTPVTKGPYVLSTTAAMKDFRASGKLSSVKFSWGAAGGSYVRFGQHMIDAVPTGGL